MNAWAFGGKRFQQLVQQTQWGELDYLIIDLPPGTGDVSLTMAQLLKGVAGLDIHACVAVAQGRLGWFIGVQVALSLSL